MRGLPTIEEVDPKGTWRACLKEHAESLALTLLDNQDRLAEFVRECIALNDDLIHTNPNVVPDDPEYQNRVLLAVTSFLVLNKIRNEGASLDDAFTDIVLSIPELTEEKQNYRIQQALTLYPRISASFRQEATSAPEARP